MNTLRRWSRLLHRDLSYFFTGVLLLYAVSGFMLNHKRDFNADYSVVRRAVAFAGSLPAAASRLSTRPRLHDASSAGSDPAKATARRTTE